MKLSARGVVAGGLKLMQRALEGSSEEVRQAVNEGARAVRNLARLSIRAKDKSGREYTRPRGEGTQKYKASAPGEAPARFTGDLADHIRMHPAKKRMRAVARVAAASKHAHLLEYGTTNMAARPFMGPAMRQAAAQNFRNIKGAARRAIRKAAGAAAGALKGKA